MLGKGFHISPQELMCKSTDHIAGLRNSGFFVPTFLPDSVFEKESLEIKRILYSLCANM